MRRKSRAASSVAQDLLEPFVEEAAWPLVDELTPFVQTESAGSTVTELGLEREGLRGDWLAVTANMGVEGGTEEEGMAGVYITRLPRR